MIIKCPKCGKNISDLAEKCIHCGYDFKNFEKEKNYIEDVETNIFTERKLDKIIEKESILDTARNIGFDSSSNNIIEEKKETDSRVCSNCNKKLSDGELFCTNCGKKYNEDGKVFCTNCGSKISEMAEICPNCGVPQKKDTTDEGGKGWWLLGCCIPIVGLILYLIWKDEKPKTARDVGKGALISTICIILFYVLFIVLGITSIFTLLQ